MAEIHIVRKRKGALWLALAGIALLLLAVWALWSVLDNDGAIDTTARATAMAAVDGADVDRASIAQPDEPVADRPGAMPADGNPTPPVVEAPAAQGAPLPGQPAAQATDPAVSSPAQPTGQQDRSAAVPVAPPAETAVGRRAAQPDPAVAPPARQPAGAQPSAAFVVPDVDARATPIESRLRLPYVGRFVSDSITLFIRDDGTYEITRSAAGPGRGAWTVLREHGVLFLDPADGSQDRYFRIQSADTLVPLNPRGRQPAQMTELLRRERDGAPGR